MSHVVTENEKNGDSSWVKTIHQCLLLLVVALGVWSCGSSDRDKQDLVVYRHALDGMPNSLDPVHSSTLYSNHLVLNLYDTLYAYQYLARPYQLKPNLAVSTPEISDDGLTYRFEIKKGVRFVDDKVFENGKGRELVAADVLYSLMRHFDPAARSQGAWLWRGLVEGLDEWGQSGADYDVLPRGLKVIDDYHFEVRLTKPYPQFIHTLALGASAIVPREAVETYGVEFAVRPVGSGPFQLQRFNSVKAVLDRNPYFRQEPFDLIAEGYDPETQRDYGVEALQGRSPPFIDRLEFHFVSEDTTRWNAILKGDEIDYARVPALHFDDVLQSRNPLVVNDDIQQRFHVLPFPEPGFVRTDFNMADPAVGYHEDPVQNERNHALRCALLKSFDFDRRNAVFYYGIGKVYPGIIPPVAPEFDPHAPTDAIENDPEAGKALLAEYGWNADNLPVLEYGYMNSVTNRQFFEQVRGFFESIGYPREKIQPLIYPSFGELNQAARESKVMLYFSGWNMDYPDAQNTMQLFYGPNKAPGANTANYANPEYDRLYEQASVMQAGDERTAIYRRMNQMVMDDCVTIAGMSRTLLLMWKRDVILMPDRSFAAGYSMRYVDFRNSKGSMKQDTQ